MSSSGRHEFEAVRAPGTQPQSIADAIMPKSPMAELRHTVLNSYQAIIACIVDESNRFPSGKANAALLRVAECFYEQASALQGTDGNPPSSAA